MLSGKKHIWNANGLSSFSFKAASKPLSPHSRCVFFASLVTRSVISSFESYSINKENELLVALFRCYPKKTHLECEWFELFSFKVASKPLSPHSRCVFFVSIVTRSVISSFESSSINKENELLVALFRCYPEKNTSGMRMV